MKKRAIILAIISVFTLSNLAHATFNSGSTGADGPFNPSADLEVVLPPNGVLNYTTVDIPAGVTVTFKKNADNTPVFMLATGDVTVAGTIDVAGKNATSTSNGIGGPGGFDGGYGGMANLPGGKGIGPGGGNPGISNGAAGGGFGSTGTNYDVAVGGVSYGTDNLLPLIGGSGGGGAGWYYQGVQGGDGGGGGGAILIASSTSITVTGSIIANGGVTLRYPNGKGGGGGSGGGIKLVANEISGNGNIIAIGGAGNQSGAGGAGRIRLETYVNNRTVSTNPPYTYGLPTSVFPVSQPSLSITSIAGTPVPPNPTGAYNQLDMLLQSSTTNPVAVDVSASNIPVGTTVNVWVIPQYGNATSAAAILSGTDQSSTASASVNLSTSYSNVVTAEATFTILQAMYWRGEEIDKVKVATRLGGESETVYITRSGKEIPAELLADVYR